MNDAPTQALSATTPALLAPADIAVRLGLIFGALCAAIARHFLTKPHLVALIIPLWTRISRAARRFERVMAQVAAGRQPRPRQPAAPGQPSRRPGPHGAPPAALPRGRGWIVRAIGYHAAAYMSQLNYLLAEPGVAELIAATPAAARILRPIAHMLGCHPIAALALPRKPRKPRPAKPPKPALPPIKIHRPHHPRTNPHPLGSRISARPAPEPSRPEPPWPWLPAKTT